MPRIRITLSYDGTDFSGWQIQNNDRTVQGELERALETMHKHHVRVHGSGRTDSGVHAFAQSAHFDTNLHNIPPGKFRYALNSLLPHDIRIHDSCRAEDDFHARYSAVYREYRYYLSMKGTCQPADFKYCLCTNDYLSIRNLNRLAVPFIGQHDFSAFAAAGDTSTSAIRVIHDAVFYPQNDKIVFMIRGNAFLWRMVRCILGTILEAEKKAQPPDTIRAIMASADRQKAGATAPPKGLFLYKVGYDESQIYKRFE